MKWNHLLLASLIMAAAGQSVSAGDSSNSLSEAERLAGWKLLFDGKSTEGWRNYKKETVSSGWKVEDGALSRVEKGAGDIITEDQFESFELSIEFRISPEGNSGIMFHVTEEGKTPWQTGPEIQINDNVNGHDPQKAGWLYQLYQPSNPLRIPDLSKLSEKERALEACRPAGEWNHLYLRQTPTQSEVMMNGVSYYRFVKGSDEWNKKVAASKFSAYELFGKPTKGHICLQDHNDLVSYRNIKVRELPADGSVPDPSHETLDVKIVEAFPGLEWDQWEAADEQGRITPMRPIVITHANDDTGRIFVATQLGSIHVLPEGAKSKETVLFLDIEDQVAPYKKNNEEGFLGLAFHPKHKENGKFYVYYTSSAEAHMSVVSEFTVDKNDPNKADPKSEKVIWKLQQPYGNHNGGTIGFGPDGYLYIGLGDGGAANDPYDNGQNLSTQLGSLLRIDVDNPTASKRYGIPKDNPFVDTKDAQPEIFAYGFRNIWRFSFDKETGDLWVGDVGQNLWEEIHIVEAGKNYGWNRWEGFHPFSNRDMADAKDSVKPVWEYDHGVGKSITSGYVYRGQAVPQLVGKFLYADYVTGKLWALDYDTKKQVVRKNYSIESQKMPILTFGEDATGEIYFSIESASGRGIYKFAKE